MIRIAAYIIVAGFAAAAANHVASASPRQHLSGDVDILINGVPQQRYAQNGRWYVEAIKAREYAIRLRNPYGVRVAVALSVDGLNTIDARQTTAAEARKWVLEPHQTIVISGWQTSRIQARRFEFTTEEKSYGQALGKTANLGVISGVFFKERVRTFVAEESSKDQSRAEPRAAAPSARRQSDSEYAATGMGRPTDHAVTQVWLDLEDTPAQTIDIRYEFRPQLVKLGILPRTPVVDPLERREGARGFEPGFSPEPPRRRGGN
jgi:hypothetical protein